MKSIQLTVRPDPPLRLEPTYQHRLQSFLYSCWEARFTEFREPGFLRASGS